MRSQVHVSAKAEAAMTTQVHFKSNLPKNQSYKVFTDDRGPLIITEESLNEAELCLSSSRRDNATAMGIINT